jgi:hypothetical protein
MVPLWNSAQPRTTPRLGVLLSRQGRAPPGDVRPPGSTRVEAASLNRHEHRRVRHPNGPRGSLRRPRPHQRRRTAPHRGRRRPPEQAPLQQAPQRADEGLTRAGATRTPRRKSGRKKGRKMRPLKFHPGTSPQEVLRAPGIVRCPEHDRIRPCPPARRKATVPGVIVDEQGHVGMRCFPCRDKRAPDAQRQLRHARPGSQAETPRERARDLAGRAIRPAPLDRTLAGTDGRAGRGIPRDQGLRDAGPLIRLVAGVGLAVWLILVGLSGVDDATRKTTPAAVQRPRSNCCRPRPPRSRADAAVAYHRRLHRLNAS